MHSHLCAANNPRATIGLYHRPRSTADGSPASGKQDLKPGFNGCARFNRYLPFLLILVLTTAQAVGSDLVYKERLLDTLVEQIPQLLRQFDPDTGRFGSGIWICQDQHPMYPLAVAYTTPGARNPYYKDPQLLQCIVQSGDPLIEEMDSRGQWVFRKKDGSTWGNIWMPWTYSRWIRTFGLVRDAMTPEQRNAWGQALMRGYTGISRTQLRKVHNIPTHHAMGLYAAGKILEQPKWCTQAVDFMHRVADHQSEGGYWSEGAGPVVGYNTVYVDALGTYYAMSNDKSVLPVLQKAAAFHRHFTYPGGQNVETIDQRNPYKASISPGNVGFTFTPAGRSYLSKLWSESEDRTLSTDLIASLLLYGDQGPCAPNSETQVPHTYVLTEAGEDRALTVRRGPWFVCLSAYTAPISRSRWIQDRQNMVSIYHEKTGLILGGGNTKLQPCWSNFTVGDTALLQYIPGDTNPDFMPQGELHHVPHTATLVREPTFGLDLHYGPELCQIRVRFVDQHTIQYTVKSIAGSTLPVAAHITLLPHLGEKLECASGKKLTISEAPIALSPADIGGRISYAGYQLHIPASAKLIWPVMPHNPYRKNGHATVTEARLVITIPLDREQPVQQVMLQVLD